MIAFDFKLLRVAAWGSGCGQRTPKQRRWRLSLRNPLPACDSDRAMRKYVRRPICGAALPSPAPYRNPPHAQKTMQSGL